MRKYARISTLLLCLACACGTFVAARLIREPSVRAWFHPGFLSAWLRVGEAMRLANAHYVDASAVTHGKLAEKALASVPSGLDAHSNYLPPAGYEQFQRQTEQVYVGIGIGWQMLEGVPVVLSVFPGSAAAEAGILPGDRIVGIDGVPPIAASISAVNRRIMGVEGTKVSLEISREGQAAPFVRGVARRKTHMPTLSGKRMVNADTAYVRVDLFESRTAGELAAALAELTGAGAKHLVLDLRDNPGGLVNAAVDTVGLFCPKGTLVATTESRDREAVVSYTTRAAPVAPGLPVAVLVNRESASAAEIVSGALQDLRRAIVVGDRTYGKGSVQTVYPLRAGAGLRITTARYLLPNGRSIHGGGVQPDVYQPIDPRERALLALAGPWRELGREHEFVRQYGWTPPQDTQLAAAVDVLRTLGSARRKMP
ncbi:MAG: S41 family peptidase [Puniceicoccales bacterium]|jgi:carboxyl-terminal processing protease|nr:S41 family peptidase [Puniceicoccales bacterium]